MNVCTECGVAPLGVKDRFCFHCGVQLRRFKLELPSLLVVEGDPDPDVLWVEGRLVNAGQFADRAQVLTPDVPWIKVYGQGEEPAPDDGWELLPGAGTPIRLRVHVPGALPQGSPGSSRVTLHARGVLNGGGPDEPVTLQVQKPPHAEVAWTDGADFCVDDGAAEVRGELTVAEPWSAPLEVESAVPWAEAALIGGDPLRVSARIRGDALRAALGEERSASAPLRLRMRFPELDGWREVAADLPLRWPASLMVEDSIRPPSPDGGISWRLPAGRRWRVALTFSNVGGMDLVVRTATFHAEGLSLYPLQRLPQEDAPWILGPGASRLVSVLVELPDDPVAVDAALRITTAMAGQPEIVVPLRFESYALPDFEGWVGIDFGTTSSCVAVWRQGSARPETGVLTGGYRVAGSQPERRDILLSSIRYRSRPTKLLRTWEIGATLASAAGDAGLHSVKRHLGSDCVLCVRYIDQQEDGTLPPVEVAADIVEQLVRDAEERLQARIRHCALTHPARFSLQALQSLCSTLEARGISIDLQLPEPVAAALHHAVRHPPAAGSADYHLLVVDLGGGTTDLALLRIQDRIERGSDIPRRHLRPEILAVTGNRWAGGDDITWAVLERYFASPGSEKRAQRDLGMEMDDAVHLREVLSATPRQERRSDGRLDHVFSIADGVKCDRARRGGEGSGSGALLPSPEELKTILDVFLEESGLLQMADELVTGAGVDPDELHVFLVGQSWMAEYLRGRMAGVFPRAVFHPGEFTPESLKAPVALGASLAHAVTGAQDLGFELDRSGIVQMPPARIGTLLLGASESQVFHPVIQTDAAFTQWRPVPVRLARERRVPIWENSGGTNELDIEIGGVSTRNTELRHVGTVRVGDHVPDAVGDEEMRKLTLEIRLNDHQQIELRILPVAPPWILATSRA